MEAGLQTNEYGSVPALRAADFDYPLPAELIAQAPAPERDQARLLVFDRGRGTLQHSTIKGLPGFLRPGDLLVFNDTRVRAARLFGHAANAGAVEVLLFTTAAGDWQCLGRPAKRFGVGTVLTFGDDVEARVLGTLGGGRYVLRFPPSVDVPQLMARHGEVPLPPYIKRPDGALAIDRERYQTVFASHEGAVAAPTAGLHFTESLLESVQRMGVECAWLTLHVGPATFLPVRSENIAEHRVDPEWTIIPEETAAAVSRAKREGRRVVAVGTTTVRALESAARESGRVEAGELWAGAFIVPGFSFRVVDALLTNFHLPRSTLLMLVAAFAGREEVLTAYAVAVRERYRFYSYGDALLIC